jgi:hypothetical protein
MECFVVFGLDNLELCSLISAVINLGPPISIEHDLYDALEFKLDVLGQDAFGELPPQRSVCVDLINFTPALALGVGMVRVPAGELFDVALAEAGLASISLRTRHSPRVQPV